MLFNPFKYQFEAEYLRDENALAVLKVRKGSEEELVYFPKKLLPPELKIGEHTALVIQPQEALKKTEAETLRQLLEELIR